MGCSTNMLRSIGKDRQLSVQVIEEEEEEEEEEACLKQSNARSCTLICLTSSKLLCILRDKRVISMPKSIVVTSGNMGSDWFSKEPLM